MKVCHHDRQDLGTVNEPLWSLITNGFVDITPDLARGDILSLLGDQ